MQRVERVLANRGYCERSRANQFLHKVVVSAAGERISRGDARVDPELLVIEGERIDPPALLIRLHKPVGYVCSHAEEEGKLVYELLPERWRRRDPPIASIGRLDKDTSGLLLFTDDGALLHRLCSPKRHVPRTYRVTLARPMSGGERQQFPSGTMRLKDDDRPLLPATLEEISPVEARLTLREGRYHQVRRMFAAVGNHVEALHRESFGPLTLAGLAVGAWENLDYAATADRLFESAVREERSEQTRLPANR